MATTTEGRRLTEAHRLAQARLGARTVQQMFAAWRLLDPEDLDRSVARWLRVALPLIGAQRAVSSRLAVNYYTTFRALETRDSSFRPDPASGVDAAKLGTSLTITGPVAVKVALARGEPLQRALGIGQSMSSRAAIRHVLAGGRDTILGAVQSDETALGWARATSGKPCAFCAMLASRGPAYGSEATASFQAHDGCQCAAEPAYTRDTAWTPGAERYRELWEETGSLTEFRRALEGAGT